MELNFNTVVTIVLQNLFTMLSCMQG